MKVKIKKTGEIIKITDYAKITLDYCDSYGNPIEVSPKEIELIADITQDEHWQDVRERAVIAAMQGILSSPVIEGVNPNPSRDQIIESSIALADELVKQLYNKPLILDS